MKTKIVEHQQLFNLGDYNNVRFKAVVELDEGDDPEAARAKAAQEVEAQFNAFEEQGKKREEAELTARRPWAVTPAMVEDVPTLREKALKAAALRKEHDDSDRLERAFNDGVEVFGVPLDFAIMEVPNYDGFSSRMIERPVATYEGLTITWHSTGHFYVGVAVEGESKLRQRLVNSLEDLGKHLEALEPAPQVGEEDPDGEDDEGDVEDYDDHGF